MEKGGSMASDNYKFEHPKSTNKLGFSRQTRSREKCRLFAKMREDEARTEQPSVVMRSVAEFTV